MDNETPSNIQDVANLSLTKEEEGQDYDKSSQASKGSTPSISELEEDVTDFVARIKRDKTRWLILRDELVFMYGVANMIALAWGFFSAHWIMPWLFTIKAPLLIGFRVFDYGRHKWHLFLLDFCYFANALILVYLWGVPHEPKLFYIAFAISHGPLTFAIVAFRNSLVFHSIDKLTSLFIHISPPLVMYTIRWHPVESSRYWYRDFDTCDKDLTSGGRDCDLPFDINSFIWLTFIPLGIFVGHSMLYFLIVQIILGKKIKKDRAYLTSYRWLTMNKSGLLFMFVNLFGKRGRVYMFGVFNWLYCFISLVPILLWYLYELAGILLFILVTGVATWNGATFYIEAFSRTYSNRPKKSKKVEVKQDDAEKPLTTQSQVV